LCRCSADMPSQSLVATRCRAFWGWRTKSPRPQIARSASAYWPSTSFRTQLIKSGSCFGFHSTACLRTWFSDSQALFVHLLNPGPTATFSWYSASSWRSKYRMNSGGADASKLERSLSTTAPVTPHHGMPAIQTCRTMHRAVVYDLLFFCPLCHQVLGDVFLNMNGACNTNGVRKKCLKHFRIAASSSESNVYCCTLQSTNLADKWPKKSAYVSKSWLVCMNTCPRNTGHSFVWRRFNATFL